LEQFYSRYVPAMKCAKVPLLDILNGLNFLPMDPGNYLKVQTILNQNSEIFRQIKHLVFLYSDRLLYFDIPRQNMRTLFRYLSNNLLPMFLRNELATPLSHRSASSLSSHHFGKFITGPPDLDNPNDLGKVPHIFIDNEKNLDEFLLLVYRAANSTICLLVDKNEELTIDFYKNIDTALGPQLNSFGAEIGDSLLGKSSSSESPHHFVYFNETTCSLRTTFEYEACKLPPVPIEALNQLCDLHVDLLKRKVDHFGDIVMKTDQDVWLVAKKCGTRLLFVVISVGSKTASNLQEVIEEVNRLCSLYFADKFLIERTVGL